MLQHAVQSVQDMRDGHGPPLHLLEQLRRPGKHPPLHLVARFSYCKLHIYLLGGLHPTCAALGRSSRGMAEVGCLISIVASGFMNE